MVVSPPAAETIFERFEIEFDAGAEPVFHGGELVTGSLKIQLKHETTINAIRIQFRGRAVFLGAAGNKKVPEGQTEKVYFDKDFVLLERPPGHPEPGHFTWNANFLYSLPFECPLPKGCETSYEGPHGFIRYYARAVLQTDEPNKAQYLVKKAFSMVSPPELHQLVPPQSEPIAEKKTVRFGGCCCRGKMTAEIQLPKSAYAPGENIVGTFSMDSRTAKSAIEHIEVRLVDRLQRILEQPRASVEPQQQDQQEEVPKENETNGKKAKKVKQPKAKKPAPAPKPEPLCQRVVFGRKLAKEEFQPEQSKGAQMVTQTNVLFIRVPAVTPSTQPESEQPKLTQSMLFNELDGDFEENGQFHRLLESPSTATLRARKEPFLRVDYALQISIGTHVLMELPIQVHAIPIYAKGIQFRPFAAGAQPIGEPDEAEMIAHGGPFTFTPQYPMYLDSPKPLAVEEQPIQLEQAVTATLAPVQDGVLQPNGMPNGGGDTLVTTTTVTTVQTERMLPDGTTTVQRKQEVVLLHDTPNPAEDEPALVQELHQAVVEHELEKSAAEMAQQPLPTESAPNEGPSVVEVAAVNAAQLEHSQHAEQVEQLPNGHSLHTTTDEWHQNGPEGAQIRRVVEEEHYEVQNEDGSKTRVQKTTEKISAVETHVEMTNGGDASIATEQPEVNDNNANAQNGEQQNLQMDVSMSG